MVCLDINGNKNYLLGVFIVCLDIQQYNNAYLQVLMWSDLAYNDMITDSSICTYNGTVAPIGFLGLSCNTRVKWHIPPGFDVVCLAIQLPGHSAVVNKATTRLPSAGHRVSGPTLLHS